jgi:hypothetical protein
MINEGDKEIINIENRFQSFQKFLNETNKDNLKYINYIIIN